MTSRSESGMDENLIKKYLDSQIKAITMISDDLQPTIKEIFESLYQARQNEKKIFVFGNGGSSANASHFVSDLLKTTLTEGTKKFKAFCLTDNTPLLLAWGNDTSFNNIFKSQLENIAEKDDIIICMSGSGNSQNILNAIDYANGIGALTIGLTGKNGGELSELAKISLIVPSNDMLTIETMHLLICHLLTTMFRETGKPIFSY